MQRKESHKMAAFLLLNAKNTNKRYDIRAAYMPTVGGGDYGFTYFGKLFKGYKT